MAYTGSIELIAVSDGSQLSVRLEASGTRTQYVTEDGGTFIPDFTTATGSRPSFTPKVFDTTNGQTALTLQASQTWKYNGAAITWGAASGGVQTSSNFDGMFQLRNGGTSAPVLTVVKNLASVTNIDNDSISFEGSVELSGTSFAITATEYINIAKLSGGTQDGILIEAINGISFDTNSDNGDTLTFEPHIIVSGTDKGKTVPAGYSVKVVGEGVSGIDHTYAAGSQVSVSVADTAVDDEGLVVMELYKNGTLVNSAAIQIYDDADPWDVVISATATVGGTTRNVGKEVRKDETVTLTATVRDRATGTAKTGTINYTWTSRSSAGATVTDLLNAVSGQANKKTLTYAKLVTYGGAFIIVSATF